MDMVRALQVLHVVHYVNTQFVYTAVFIHTYIEGTYYIHLSKHSDYISFISIYP